MADSTLKAGITTAGQLRAALEYVQDDTPIFAQVCGADGTAWALQATLGDIPRAVPRKLVISLRHPDLATLPMAGEPYWKGLAP